MLRVYYEGRRPFELVKGPNTRVRERSSRTHGANTLTQIHFVLALTSSKVAAPLPHSKKVRAPKLPGPVAFAEAGENLGLANFGRL
jgi:hypothetical protein